jgi:2-phospho-L-lactate guanylyltransferase (CobY/MobA/RfbA family)
MASIVIPVRIQHGKSRLHAISPAARVLLASAMLQDVLDACEAVAETFMTDADGQGDAVAAMSGSLEGPVAVVNADLPCATSADVRALLAAAPALVPAADGTTNALSLADAGDFRPLYGSGSAARFEALGLRRLLLPNLSDDVDTLEDLERVADRVGPHTRDVLDAVLLRA